VNNTAKRPFLIIKNLVTDSGIFVTENCNIAKFVAEDFGFNSIV